MLLSVTHSTTPRSSTMWRPTHLSYAVAGVLVTGAIAAPTAIARPDQPMSSYYPAVPEEQSSGSVSPAQDLRTPDRQAPAAPAAQDLRAPDNVTPISPGHAGQSASAHSLDTSGGSGDDGLSSTEIALIAAGGGILLLGGGIAASTRVRTVRRRVTA
jgi:hypothetical protein